MGSDPRGWIVASTMLFSNANHPRDVTLLQKASAAAPNDAFVQLMVTQMSETSAPEWSAAQGRLERLEPENGAVWLNTLNAASRSGNAVAVDDSLDRFSKSVRFDTHQTTLAKEMVAALSSRPMPDLYFPEAAGIPNIRKELIAPTISYLVANVVATLPTASLSKECAPDKARDGIRALNCDLSLHLLLTAGDTFFARSFAAKQLFNRHSLSYDDNEIIRSNDWLYAQWMHADAADPAADLELRARKINDFLEFGNEIEGMRHFLQASNTAVQPPADWLDKFAPKANKLGLKEDENHSPPAQ
jgi:hypothetical protein